MALVFFSLDEGTQSEASDCGRARGASPASSEVESSATPLEISIVLFESIVVPKRDAVPIKAHTTVPYSLYN